MPWREWDGREEGAIVSQIIPHDAAGAVGNAGLLPALAQGHFPHPCSLALWLAVAGVMGEAPWCPAGRAVVHAGVPIYPREGAATSSQHQKTRWEGHLHI